MASSGWSSSITHPSRGAAPSSQSWTRWQAGVSSTRATAPAAKIDPNAVGSGSTTITCSHRRAQAMGTAPRSRVFSTAHVPPLRHAATSSAGGRLSPKASMVAITSPPAKSFSRSARRSTNAWSSFSATDGSTSSSFANASSKFLRRASCSRRNSCRPCASAFSCAASAAASTSRVAFSVACFIRSADWACAAASAASLPDGTACSCCSVAMTSLSWASYAALLSRIAASCFFKSSEGVKFFWSCSAVTGGTHACIPCSNASTALGSRLASSAGSRFSIS